MSQRFLKFIPSEEAFWLMHNKPNAFKLLMHIANTARRTSGHPDGLLIGECYLQSWNVYDLTEREYRTAKQVLVDRKHIIIIETNRTRKKSTTGTTTKSTKVKLCSSTIWDINSETNDDSNDDRPTTDRRLTDDKQERIRRIKKDKEIPTPTPSVPAKIKFREFVQLTQAEYDSLLAKNGQAMLDLMLDCLDSYKGSSGKAYESDFHTMKQGGWVVNRVKKDMHERNVKTAPRQHGSDIQPSGTQFVPRSVLRGSNTGQIPQGGIHA